MPAAGEIAKSAAGIDLQYAKCYRCTWSTPAGPRRSDSLKKTCAIIFAAIDPDQAKNNYRRGDLAKTRERVFTITCDGRHETCLLMAFYLPDYCVQFGSEGPCLGSHQSDKRYNKPKYITGRRMININ